MKLITERWIRKLENFTPLTAQEKASVEACVTSVRQFSSHADLFKEGEPPDGVNLILDGFACRYKLLRDGRRQIVAYLIPGDTCDVRVFLLKRMDHSIGTLGPVQAALMSRQALTDLTERFPKLTRALWWSTLVEEAVTREWVVNVGNRTAFERVAHLFCEMYTRLQSVSLASSGACEFPITQHEIGETVALSAVHVNRTIMELRRTGLVTFQSRRLIIHDFAALANAAGFDTNYLHLDSDRRPVEELRERLESDRMGS
jgi:CRP-like cAMP-binding protein